MADLAMPMRILLANWTRRRTGGAETYLGRILPLLAARRHSVALAYEVDEPVERPAIVLPEGCAGLPLANEDGLERIRAWKPDVTYVHGLLNPEIERNLLGLAPAVLFAHGYYGTCISGQKTHRLPVVQPCDRVFGPACLALFYPRRCGGLSPITMAREYRQQAARFDQLGRYAAVMTHSEHMRREFIRHRAAGGRVHHAPVMRSETEALATPSRLLRSREANEPWRLVFVGRMDRLKGGDYLLGALPRTHQALGLPLRVTFAGDGPERSRWERRAAEITASMPAVSVEFTGWLQPPGVRALFDAADLLVVPSLWPEPYGLVGPEAARRGVPSVAFATGGIPEWLTDGVNGCLAPGDRPSADGLADALIRCLRSLGSSDALRHGALASVEDEEDNRHVDALLEILNDAASRRVQAAPGTAS